MEFWHWLAMIPTLGVTVSLICMGIISVAEYMLGAPKREAARKLKANPNLLKSEAFCAGYRDMAKAFSRESRAFVGLDYSYDIFNNPSLPQDCMNIIGSEALDMRKEFDLSMGQSSEKYLGGSDQEFQDYYLGGLHFVSDMDEAKTKAQDKRNDGVRRKKIIEARRMGLHDINQKIASDMRELDTLRNKTFSTAEFEKNWDRQLKELTRGIS